jgi:hypothetical protein
MLNDLLANGAAGSSNIEGKVVTGNGERARLLLGNLLIIALMLVAREGS